MAIPFFALLLGAFDLSYDLFLQAELDTVVEQAARGVQVGTVQNTGDTSSQFSQVAICAKIHGPILCDATRLKVGVVPVPPAGTDAQGNPIPGDYFTSQNILSLAEAASKSGVICTGAPGQMMFLKVWYIGPTFVGKLIPFFSTTRDGHWVHITTASAAFVNEYFPGGETCTAAT